MSKHTILLVYWFFVAVLIIVSYLPWVYYEDINEVFTGFYTYQNIYGKPAYLLILFTFITGILLFISKLWARFISLGLMSIVVAYTIKIYFLFTICHNGICPQIKIGLWLMILSILFLFIFSLLGKIRKKIKK